MDNSAITNRIQTVISLLDERQKRIYLAAEAESLGRGGMGIVGKIAGVNKNTMTAGRNDLAAIRSGSTLTGIDPKTSSGKSTRIRKQGGGRKTISFIGSDPNVNVSRKLRGIVQNLFIGSDPNVVNLRFLAHFLYNMHNCKVEIS